MSNPNIPPPPETTTLAPSLVRTLIPFVAGLVGTWLLDHVGLRVDTATVGALLTAGVGYLYYVVVRFAEVYGSDKWGYILGVRSQPVYAAPAPDVADVRGRHEAGEVNLCGVGMGLIVLGFFALVVSLLVDSPTGVTLSGVGLVAGVLLVVVSSRAPR